MRVAFWGNHCNNLYQIAKALRRHSDIDAHLYLDTRDDGQMRPESDDPALLAGYPDWIHQGAFLTPASALAPWRSALVRELASYDLVIVSGTGPIFAQFAGRPWCFFVTGGDLTILPFPLTFLHMNRRLRGKLAQLVTGVWQRRGIRRATEIWSVRYSPFTEALARLRVTRPLCETYLPLAIDTETFGFKPHSRNGEFVVFHPSRLMINSDANLKRTGQWKRNDALFEGFARFVLDGGARNAVLAMPDRTVSPDVALAKEIVRRLGIESHVRWLRPPRPFGFTRHEMIDLYSAADVVADDFGIGWIGSVVLEALAIGRPVLSYIDEGVMRSMYPWHPIVSCRTPEEIADCLLGLYRDPARRQEIGQRGRDWIKAFHDPSHVSEVYCEAVRSLAGRITWEARRPR